MAAALFGLSGAAWGQAAPSADAQPAAAAPAPPPTPAPPAAAAPPAPAPAAQPAPNELPPPPPPKAAPPPPAQGKVMLSAPPLPPPVARKGYKVHDSFYLRLGAGLGGGRANISTDHASVPDFQVGGAGLALNLWIGGTPWSGIAIGGLASLQGIRESDTRVEGTSTDEGMETGAFLLGPFIDAFPDPQRGLHFGGSIALASFAANADDHALEDDWAVTNYNGGGLGGSAWVGYMGFVGPEWSLGGLLQLSGGYTAKADADDVKRQASFGTLSLSFTALYH